MVQRLIDSFSVSWPTDDNQGAQSSRVQRYVHFSSQAEKLQPKAGTEAFRNWVNSGLLMELLDHISREVDGVVVRA